MNIRFRSDQTDRLTVYAPLLEADDSPIIISKLQSIDDLFYEPIYQVVRHILMAHEIKKHHEEIDEVVVLHLRSERNLALLENPSQGLSTSSNVYDAIRVVMRKPEMLMDVGYEMLRAKAIDMGVDGNCPDGYLRDRYAMYNSHDPIRSRSPSLSADGTSS